MKLTNHTQILLDFEPLVIKTIMKEKCTQNTMDLRKFPTPFNEKRRYFKTFGKLELENYRSIAIFHYEINVKDT